MGGGERRKMCPMLSFRLSSSVATCQLSLILHVDSMSYNVWGVWGSFCLDVPQNLIQTIRRHRFLGAWVGMVTDLGVWQYQETVHGCLRLYLLHAFLCLLCASNTGVVVL